MNIKLEIPSLPLYLFPSPSVLYREPTANITSSVDIVYIVISIVITLNLREEQIMKIIPLYNKTPSYHT